VKTGNIPFRTPIKDLVIRILIQVYQKLPFRPFRSTLALLYADYRKARKDGKVYATVGHINYLLDLNEMIDCQIYYQGVYERVETERIRQIVKPGMFVCDVGANIGYFTLNLARLVGDTGRVFAFEPTEWAFRRLSTNITLNDFRNIVANKYALSDSSATGRKDTRIAAFRASWTLDGSSPTSKDETLEFTTLDQYFGNDHKRLDFMKIDVDGYEYRVIKGARETIQTFRPILFLEIGRWTMEEVGDRPEELVDLLADLGYCFLNPDGSKRYSSPRHLLDAIPFHQAKNILCIPDEKF